MSYYQLFRTEFPEKVTIEDVLTGYRKGYFPMGNSNSIGWIVHIPRAIFPIDKGLGGIKISRSLKQVLNKKLCDIKIDYDFESVIKHCAKCHKKEGVWITKDIKRLYIELYEKGFAHSVEAYRDGKLTGGLYGVSINSAFFGESMFHLEDNASKVCLVHLYQILVKNHFLLFDIQMLTPLMKTLGAIEIEFDEYLKKLDSAILTENKFKI